MLAGMELDYSTTQLDPNELAELIARRAVEARAQAARDYDRPRMLGAICRSGPDTFAELERQRDEYARAQSIGPQVRAPQRGGGIGGHPQSRPNGSGFKGVRPRLRAYEPRRD
jgi:hypothetical protein